MALATRLVGDKEAAPIIGAEPSTLKNSRYTGILAGVEPPAYLKIGRAVRYEVETLLQWRDQFQRRTSTRTEKGEYE